MLEKQIERKLADEIKNRDGMCLKQTGISGIPDRLVLLPGGKTAFVELKSPGKKPRKLQAMRMKQLMKLGIKCYVLGSAEQIGGMLDEIQSS